MAMDNLIITQYFEWDQRLRGLLPRLVERTARRLHLKWHFERAMDPMRDMTNVMQRANLWHFATQVIAYGVAGDFAEFGCFDGKTAVLFQKILDVSGDTRKLHLYDHFQIAFTKSGRNIKNELRANFVHAGASLPVIHEGDFADTVPAQLPTTLAFVHIDCGFGGDSEQHEQVVYRLLEHVYPRMRPGAVALLMDYYEEGRCSGINHNPGVARAARRFFEAKPEKVSLLWADEYSHGYFRKASFTQQRGE